MVLAFGASASSVQANPCDIYATAGTPCVAAHSTTRALYAAYKGALYQVRRSDGQTKDIGVLAAGGNVDIATQDSFLTGKTGTISIIYDQTSNHNDLKKSGVATWLANGGNEANATSGQIKINGHTAYGIYVTGGSNIAYRNNSTKGVATGNQAEAMYAVVDGKRYSTYCCFDYGNAETDAKDDGNGTMEAIYWGTDVGWGGYGEGSGPWIAADLENGMFKGNAGGYNYGSTHTTPWSTALTVSATYATLVLKGPSTNNFEIKAGSSQSGKLTTMWNGTRPSPNYSPKTLQGAIILGTGGDGSNNGTGTFFEGAMTSGNPPDSIDDKIQADVIAAGYGSNTTTSLSFGKTQNMASASVRFDASTGAAVVGFNLASARHVRLRAVDLQGRVVATLLDGDVSTGGHDAVWNARNVQPGIYILSLDVEGQQGWSGKVLVGR
jgi:hypothetical protein